MPAQRAMPQRIRPSYKEHTVQHPTGIAIWRALPAEASILTDIAFAAKRHWGYPEAWIAQWRSALTITPQQIASVTS